MPAKDGTGPMGLGSMTGRGHGRCEWAVKTRTGRGRRKGLGCRRGSGRGLGRYLQGDAISSETNKELLQKQKELFQKRVEAIDKQLENL